ncbi:hypothetical protein BU15DRAFT_67538 [Melanogaster broomeanus]|nr:hypothetical protein BU15DRAFT_67538 [Melanogaster broomeanus]
MRTTRETPKATHRARQSTTPARTTQSPIGLVVGCTGDTPAMLGSVLAPSGPKPKNSKPGTRRLHTPIARTCERIPRLTKSGNRAGVALRECLEIGDFHPGITLHVRGVVVHSRVAACDLILSRPLEPTLGGALAVARHAGCSLDVRGLRRRLLGPSPFQPFTLLALSFDSFVDVLTRFHLRLVLGLHGAPAGPVDLALVAFGFAASAAASLAVGLAVWVPMDSGGPALVAFGVTASAAASLATGLVDWVLGV